MKSKKEKNNYVVLRDDQIYPTKLNIKKTNATITKLEKAFASINETLADLYRSNKDLYYLLSEEVLDFCSLEPSEGKCWKLDCAERVLRETLNQLDTGNDEIQPAEEVETLGDIGYQEFWNQSGIWEKKLEDSKEKEVVEEIFMYHGAPVRRTRTIEWEYRPGVKSSKNIRYKNLRIGKKLARTISNTFRDE